MLIDAKHFGFCAAPAPAPAAANSFASLAIHRETFQNIYCDISSTPGKCKFAESGFGWRPTGGGDTFTLDKNNIISAQWSYAAKGRELKVLARTAGVIQLDGFAEEVREIHYALSLLLSCCLSSLVWGFGGLLAKALLSYRTLNASAKPLSSGTESISNIATTLSADGTGEKPS